MIIPATSGTQSMVELSPSEHAGLIRAFSELQTPIDMLLVDTAAGISDMVMSFARAAQDVMVVVCDEPTSITDAYALIKLLSREYGVFRFRIVANMVRLRIRDKVIAGSKLLNNQGKAKLMGVFAHQFVTPGGETDSQTFATRVFDIYRADLIVGEYSVELVDAIEDEVNVITA